MADRAEPQRSQRPLAGRRITEVLATSTGGIGTHLRSILAPLAASGAAAQVCGPAATERLFGFTAAGARFAPVEIAAGFSPLTDLRAVAALARAAAGTELVHAHGLRAGLVATLARRRAGRRWPLVVTLHNPAPAGGGPKQRLLRAVEGATVRSADLVLAASADLADNARRQGARDVRPAPVAAPALPPSTRPTEEVRAALGASGRPLVLAVGRLHPQKGYDVLLAAAARWATDARLPAVPLVVVAGDGPLHDELAGRIAAQRLPVTLLGRRSDVADLVRAADVCVLPSRWEARSLTAQEALQAGTPLVATRTGGLPELLGAGAELVPVGDDAALADAVTGLLVDPARAAGLVEAGRAQAATWPDEAATARQLVAVYRELLGDPAKAPG